MNRFILIRNLAGIVIGVLAMVDAGLAQSSLSEILPDDIAATADVSVLEAEAKVFSTIKKGVTLSLAVCTGVDNCQPTVNRAELEQIITTLSTRIENITQRYEQSKDTALEGLLVAYADAKEGYSQDLDKLGTMVPEEPEEAPDLFGSDFSDSGADVDAEFAIFRDADDDLQDDEDASTEESVGTGQEAAAPNQ